MIGRAERFAEKAHAGQVRKYSGLPYIIHPRAVAVRLHAAGLKDEVVAAGYLHDVLEDTEVRSPRLLAEFGSIVTSLVEQVTNVACKFDGNRAKRKAMERWHLGHATADAQSIKLADLIDNSTDLLRAATEGNYAAIKFGPQYFREKDLLLPVLRHGNPLLRTEASELLLTGLRAIRQNELRPQGSASAEILAPVPLLDRWLIGGL